MNRPTGVALLAILAIALSMGQGCRNQEKPPAEVTGARNDLAPLLLSTDKDAPRFRGVGKLSAFRSCTATLIAATDAPPQNSPALILTAGHCVGDFSTNAVWVDKPANSEWRYTPAYFQDTQSAHKAFAIDRVLYATMKTTDLAVLRLAASYGELAQLSVRPIKLAHPEQLVRNIELLQIPVNGIAPSEAFLRLAKCQNGSRQDIFEGNAPWFWRQAVINNCLGVTGGSSGGPVFEQSGNQVIGVLNTTVTPDLSGCGTDRPCEARTTQPMEGMSYAVVLASLIPALKPDGSFDSALLDPGKEVSLTHASGLPWVTRSQVKDDQGNEHPAVWGLLMSEAFERVRLKTGLAAETDCEDSNGYGELTSTRSQPLLAMPVSSKSGVYIACARGESVAGERQRFATFALRWIDDIPPTLKPTLRIIEAEPGYWQVRAMGSRYEIPLVKVKYGHRGEVDCTDLNGYEFQHPIGYARMSKASEWTFCSYGLDLLEQRGPALETDFIEPGTPGR